MLRLLNTIWIVLMIAGAVVTYAMKDRAGRAADHVAQLKAEIAREKEALTLLKAEWSVLDQPSRLQALVQRYADYLNLHAFDVRQIASIGEVPEKPPLAPPVLDGTTTSSVPQRHQGGVQP